MPRKILAPHRVQDGWAYWRLNVTTVKNAANAPTINPLWLVDKDTLACVKASDLGVAVGYSDDAPGSRIISSRRVEEAVETADFLKLCEEERLAVVRDYRGNWYVGLYCGKGIAGQPLTSIGAHSYAMGRTLREAYYRYKAEAVASEPAKAEPTTRYCADCKHRDSNGGDEPCVSCIDFLSNGDWPRPGWEPKND